MTTIFRAEFTTNEPNLIAPKNGSKGRAWRAAGHYSPDSAEFEAWLFAPDKDPEESAYYCDSSNLIFEKQTA